MKSCFRNMVPVPDFSASRSVCLLAALLFFFLIPGTAFAQQRELKTDATELVDAVLVLDASGSMLLNDPARLRDEGARLFSQFLRSGDRLAVIRFAEEASVLRPLSPFETGDLDELGKLIGAIESNGQYTDILAGIKGAAELLKQNARKEARPVIVLLSDGKMDPPPAKGSSALLTDQLMNTVLPELKSTGVRIYTLAFSEEADKNLLGQIAAATEGVNWFTPTADKVHESYAELFLTVKKPQVIPLGGKSFDVDPDIQEATFYINREDGQEVAILGPEGRRITPETQEPDVKWFNGQKFDVVTLLSPKTGSWQVTGISPQEGFATVLTSLKLVTDWPVSVDAGNPTLLQARLYEGQKPVALPDMTDVIRYAFQITPTDKVSEPVLRELMVDDGSNGDKIAHDGIYSYTVKLQEQGEYRLRVIAKAPTFERQQQIPFRVKPEVVSVRVVPRRKAAVNEKEAKPSAETARGGRSIGREEHVPSIESANGEEVDIQVLLSEETRSFKNVQVKLNAYDVQRKNYLLPISKSLDDPLLYEVPGSILRQEGRYELRATLTGEGKNRAERRDVSRTVIFNLTSADSKNAEEEAVLIVEKPKGPTLWQRIPILEILIISLINGVAGYFALKLLKQAQGAAATEVADYEVPAKTLSGIAALEKKLSVREVDLNDPMFNEEPKTAEAPPPAAEAPVSETADAAQASQAEES